MQNGQCKLELEMFSTRLLEDERGRFRQRIIILVMEPIPPELMNTTLRLLLNHVSHLEWDRAAEERCWGQIVATLRALMPARNEERSDGDNDDDDADEDHNDYSCNSDLQIHRI